MMRTALMFASVLLMTSACDKDFSYEPAERIARDLVVACPAAYLNSESARNACSDSIARSATLIEYSHELMRWGRLEATEDVSFDPQSHSGLTQLGALTVRRAYLSMFQFLGEGEIEEIDDSTVVLRMPVRFRNEMSAGAYPEPFWWNADLWDAYQVTSEVWFVFIDERIVAIYLTGRSAERATFDPGPLVTSWTWIDDDGIVQPYVAQLDYLFSEDNPYVEELRETSDGFLYAMSMWDCTSCHVPDNPEGLRHHVLLNYANPTLGVRERLVTVFESRSMPPGEPLEDHANDDLLRRAIAFDVVADLAIAYEEGR